MNYLLIGIVIFLLALSLAYGYTAPNYASVNLTLGEAYTAPTYSSVNITLGDSSQGGTADPCIPTLNAQWSITTNITCTGYNITTGTGNTTITTPGTLTLINSNLTTKYIVTYPNALKCKNVNNAPCILKK